MAKRQFDDMRQWAAVGASHRLVELQEEQAAIFRAFPELRQGPRRGRPRAIRGTAPAQSNPQDFEADNIGKGRGVRRHRRRVMSPEARKRISDAQKARWAKQKAGAASAPSSRKKR